MNTEDRGAWPRLLAGATAGAAGTAALNLLTYLDMAIRGRPASTTPEQTVEALAALLHCTIPGGAETQANRVSGLGALIGLGAGIGVGALLGLLCGRRRPGPALITVVATAGALIGTNGPMTVLGVTNPLTWGAAAWVADVIPHLGYGLVTAFAWHHLSPPR